mmetsp:Transcript_464/g.1452  ORF Transcript_464/g.1452 Transcript_464/m.1452 type:complete len:281 (-) Transcript_464:1422-2264(-)
MQFSSVRPGRGTNQSSLLMAALTVGLFRSASLARITRTSGFCSPPLPPASGIAIRASEVTTSQKHWNPSNVFGKRLVPYSNCKTMMIEVCFLRISKRQTTSSTMRCRTVLRLSSETLPRKASRTSGMVPRKRGGKTRSSAWRSSAGRLPERWRCRKTPTVLRSSSTATRSTSLSRGPMEPKTGSICKCAAAWQTMCSASSILPMPVLPSISTTPPSANGLPAGACTCRPGTLSTVLGRLCRSASKRPPRRFWTLLIPSQLGMPQIWDTFTLICDFKDSSD